MIQTQPEGYVVSAGHPLAAECFLSTTPDKNGVKLSPVFPSVVPLFAWCKDNGWKQKERGLQSTYVQRSEK